MTTKRRRCHDADTVLLQDVDLKTQNCNSIDSPQTGKNSRSREADSSRTNSISYPVIMVSVVCRCSESALTSANYCSADYRVIAHRTVPVDILSAQFLAGNYTT